MVNQPSPCRNGFPTLEVSENFFRQQKQQCSEPTVALPFEEVWRLTGQLL
jgi:hypothetical protein